MAKRVYFAFHYDDVLDFRANVVRKHNVMEGVGRAGYFDSSMWEEARNTSNLALKRLINAELEYTTVTAVLVGSDTWARPWVRYEIFKSIERGNKLLAIHINGIAGKDRLTKILGPNPFDNLGLQFSDDGEIAKPTEWNGSQWAFFTELEPFRVSKRPAQDWGRNSRLSTWFPIYDWVGGRGYENFSSWIE